MSIALFRYDSEGIATHDRSTLKAVGALKLEDLAEKARNYDVIGIDEGQFVREILSVVINGNY